MGRQEQNLNSIAKYCKNFFTANHCQNFLFNTYMQNPKNFIVKQWPHPRHIPFMHLSMVCPMMGGGDGRPQGNLNGLPPPILGQTIDRCISLVRRSAPRPVPGVKWSRYELPFESKGAEETIFRQWVFHWKLNFSISTIFEPMTCLCNTIAMLNQLSWESDCRTARTTRTK